SAVPEHYEVVPTRRGKLRDHFRGMAGAQLDLELYPCSRRSFACLLRKPAEEEVLLAFDRFDLADPGGVGGQRPFDGEGSELRVGGLRQLERLREGTVGGIGTVDRDQDSLERHQLLTCSVAAIGRGWGSRLRSASTSGWKKRCAMAVGTI